jgi:hypothetical protein
MILSVRIIDLLLDIHRDLVIHLVISPMNSEIHWSIPNLIEIEKTYQDFQYTMRRFLGIIRVVFKLLFYSAPTWYGYERQLYWVKTRKRRRSCRVIRMRCHLILIPFLWNERMDYSSSSYPGEIMLSLSDYFQFWFECQSQVGKRMMVGFAWSQMIIINIADQVPLRRSLVLISRVYIVFINLGNSNSGTRIKEISDPLIGLGLVVLLIFIGCIHHLHVIRICLWIESVSEKK